MKWKSESNTLASKELFEYCRLDGKTKHQFMSELEHPFHRKRYAIIRKLLKNYANGVLLDIGCAEGWLTFWSLNHVDSAIGIDLSLPKVKRAAQDARDTRTQFVVASFDNLPFKENTFNTVIWSEGPEHAIHSEHVLKEITSLMQYNGVLLTTTMGLCPPKWYKLFRQLTLQWENEVEENKRWGHVTLFKKEDFSKFVSRCLVIQANIFLRPLILFPLHRAQNFFCNSIQKLTGRYVGSAWPGFGCIIIVARKNSKPNT